MLEMKEMRLSAERRVEKADSAGKASQAALQKREREERK
jgi:hypothetical protein